LRTYCRLDRFLYGVGNDVSRLGAATPARSSWLQESDVDPALNDPRRAAIVIKGVDDATLPPADPMAPFRQKAWVAAWMTGRVDNPAVPPFRPRRLARRANPIRQGLARSGLHAAGHFTILPPKLEHVFDRLI
jgi:hypothetical protein